MLAAVALSVLALAAVALGGCGGHSPRPAALRLERADLVLLARTLRRLQGPVGVEVAAARTVWPTLAHGVPRSDAAATRLAVASAAAHAVALPLPSLLTTEGALTGPAAGIGGLLKDYTTLVQRGWRIVAAATAPAEAGAHPDSGARARPAGDSLARTHSVGAGSNSSAGIEFLRANSGLYVYCIYDGHFDLSVLGKKFQSAYAKLGGAAAFGAALRPAEVTALAAAYSTAAVRLESHPGPGVHV